MYIASVYNSNAGTIELTGNEDRYQVISITGLNPPQAQINMTDPAGIDGVLFNTSRLLMRNIVITLRINGEVEKNRLELYRYFNPGDKVRFNYENNRSVYIDGRINTVECEIFSMSEVMQISIICPDPYFRDGSLQEASWSGNVAAAVNNGDEEVGFRLTFEAGQTAYLNSITLLKVDAGETLTIQGSFRAYDHFEIDTENQSFWIIRNGMRINGLNYVVRGSVFSTIKPGTSQFRLTCKSGSITFPVDNKSLTFEQLYRGV